MTAHDGPDRRMMMSANGQPNYPRIRLRGDAHARGRTYGEQAAGRVHRSIDAYRDMFADLGTSWDEALDIARPYADIIGEYGERYLDEIRGIAEGADAPFEHVLAINVRTEIISPATMRRAARANGECSAMAAMPTRTADGHTLIAQNWDNALHTAETVVVLEVEQDDRPNFVTIVEAGLLAKAGFNSAGLGSTTNALITTVEGPEPGAPLHVILRAILDAETISEGMRAIQGFPRASSANYLLAHRDGLAVDIEAAPGDFSATYRLFPEDGLIVHTNHFITSPLPFGDVMVKDAPDSFFRLERVRAALGERAADGGVTPDDLQAVLTDHANYPDSVCCHANLRPRDPGGASMASVIMDLDAGHLWLAEGNPCESGYTPYDYSELLTPKSRWPVGVS